MKVVFIFTVMLCMGFLVVWFYRRREKKLIEKLQTMVNSAANGTYNVDAVDESTLSALENSMNRYLADCAVSSNNLSEQKKKIQTLIADISHQTITPISNILLYSQLLEEKDYGKEYEEEIIAIREQTEKLSFLIDSLVKLSRLETGIITVEPKWNKIQEMMDKVIRQVQSKADKKGISLNSAIMDMDAMAVFDMKWTVEAIYNIVDNAVKYTPDCGKVSISVIPYSFFLRIDIADNGIGIAESEYNKIFGRFYRSKATNEVEGVGIGLFLAREIISLQRGYIKVSSKEGEGSVFSVFLPLQECNKTVIF